MPGSRRRRDSKPDERIVRAGELTFRVLSSTWSHGAATQRPPFVLVHGIGVSHRYLARLHAVLSETDAVYSVDLPGFGGLPKPPWSTTVADMAEGLGRVLDTIGLEKVVLLGHSMGAQWVVELARQRPGIASQVVVIGPVTDDAHDTMLAQSIALAVDTLGEPPVGNFLVFTDYAFRCGPIWYLRQARHMVDYRIHDRVRGLSVPLLIIRGGEDPIAGLAWCRRLRDSAPDATLVVVPGHRHLVQHTGPKTVASALHAVVDDAPLMHEGVR